MNETELANLSREQLVEMLGRLDESGIRISFSGKDNARSLARKVRPRVMRRVKKYSVGSDEEQSRNLLVEGDNLQAMATLYRERGSVDLILTDPPYNTGNDWRYNDRWDEDPNDPGLGDWVSEDDGARHTKWMRFMWPRLQMMKSMLKPSGVLAICIDHRELFRLGQLLDEPELFGEENRIAIINWQKSYSPRSDNIHVSTATEYVLVYARDIERTDTGLLPRTEEMNARYGNPDGDPKGDWAGDNPCAGEGPTHPGMVYGIQSPFTGEIHYPPAGKCWRMERPRMKAWLEEWGGNYESRDLEDGCPSPALVLKGSSIMQDGSAWHAAKDDERVAEARSRAVALRDSGDPWPGLIFLKEGDGKPRVKRYLSDVKQGVVPMTYWADDDYELPVELGSVSWPHEQSGHSQTGINELNAIVGQGHGFDTVKPLKLFQKIVNLWCPPDGLVLDPFAGSGTTGHAVLALNRISDAWRRFILIEQGSPENGDPYARGLTADRLARSVSGDWVNGKGKPLGGGFRFSSLAKKVDAEVLLRMERAEMIDTVIASHSDLPSSKSQLTTFDDAPFEYLLARNENEEGIYLVWSGPDGNTNFTEAVYEACSLEAEQAGLKPVFHVYARLYLYQTRNVRFYQIPDRILTDFGLDLKTETFLDDD